MKPRSPFDLENAKILHLDYYNPEANAAVMPVHFTVHETVPIEAAHASNAGGR